MQGARFKQYKKYSQFISTFGNNLSYILFLNFEKKQLALLQM